MTQDEQVSALEQADWEKLNLAADTPNRDLIRRIFRRAWFAGGRAVLSILDPNAKD